MPCRRVNNVLSIIWLPVEEEAEVSRQIHCGLPSWFGKPQMVAWTESVDPND